jgi:lipoate-protein ligase A
LQFAICNALNTKCRFLPYIEADGPHNMAADDALLQSAVHGLASLRFYGWITATVSLGYFQPVRRRQDDPRTAALPFVRRASGGDALVHHHEVTYALALPAGAPWQLGESWPKRMHGIIAAALREFGIESHLHVPAVEARFAGALCFQHLAAGDVLIGASKVVGSAQRRQRGALLQHGGMLLARSPHAPDLAGIGELSGGCLTVQETCDSVRRAFVARTGWDLGPGEWTNAEREAVERLAANKYSQDWWNCKR